MKTIKIFSVAYLLLIAANQVYAAEVRVCNKSEVIFNNILVNHYNYRKLNIGECSQYYKDRLAQEYVTIGVHLDGKSLSYSPTKTSFLLGDGQYSYNIFIKDGHLDLETHKD